MPRFVRYVDVIVGSPIMQIHYLQLYLCVIASRVSGLLGTWGLIHSFEVISRKRETFQSLKRRFKGYLRARSRLLVYSCD